MEATFTVFVACSKYVNYYATWTYMEGNTFPKIIH